MSVEKRDKFSLIEEIFRQINYLVISQVKNVTFTKFLPKKYERQFPQFSHCVQWLTSSPANFTKEEFI